MPNLALKQCENSTDINKLDNLTEYLLQVPLWTLNQASASIYRKFEFKNFKQTMFFINAVAYICEQQGHHPDAKFSYNYCEIAFTTHDVGGLSINDFICASKLDTLLTV